ncbi:ANTAR domain-containing response regulator [Methyloversatilis thermotolerans]|uniref:ANTAR domain-containing response regulator n=1 Tax=Methyloversatilis thermotolerans TaxID=1346290 RepID=UPI0003780786|nr:response regulator [Methyloversatilis thermotolerans]
MNASPSEPIRLLWVDDDRLVAATLAGSLKDNGYAIELARSAEEAWPIIDHQTIDLVILDERLPGQSGLEFAAELKQRGMPFLFLTAYGDTALVHGAVQNGALAYLVKPIDTAQMLAAVRTALARSLELRELRNTGKNLQRALDERREISIAVGILMERMRIDRQPAFEMLRKSARSQRRRIEDVARELMQPYSNSPHAAQ